jgi:hypothetical protein
MRFLALAMLFACSGAAPPAADPCDSAQLPFACNLHSNGACREFTGLSTADRNWTQSVCERVGGTALIAACATASRLGTCNMPPTGANTWVSCSPHAQILTRYFAPYTQADAQTECNDVPGATWTPN